MARLEIHFAPDGPVASHLLSSTPTRTRGESVTLELGFDPSWAGYGGFYGTNGMAEYRAMEDQLEFVNPVHTGLQRTGVPWVREELPSRAPVSTQIFEVTPGSDVQDIDPFWAVITGGEDLSEPPVARRRFSVDVVFLADGSEYATRTELKNDLGAMDLA